MGDTDDELDLDAASLEPTVWISAAVLQDALPILDAFTELFQWGSTDLESYSRALVELRPILDSLDDRCRWRGVEGRAHDDHEHEFMAETATWALEVATSIRDSLHAAGHDAHLRD
jgi:hypothetical protein